MKIITNTPDELVLERRPILGGAIVIAATLLVVWIAMNVIANGNTVAGILILAIGLALCLAAFWGFIRYDAIRFSRTEGTVQMRSRSLAGTGSDDIALDKVTAAIMETSMVTARVKSRSGRGSTTRNTRTYRVALSLRDAAASSRPLVPFYTSDEAGMRRLIETINGWLLQRPPGTSGP